MATCAPPSTGLGYAVKDLLSALRDHEISASPAKFTAMPIQRMGTGASGSVSGGITKAANMSGNWPRSQMPPRSRKPLIGSGLLHLDVRILDDLAPHPDLLLDRLPELRCGAARRSDAVALELVR